MKTKQEQIEEMRREIENGFRKSDCREAYTNKPYPYFETQKIAIAEALYNAGYRKVPEYAVIIPAEEREAEMKATNEILAERDGLKAEIERLKAVLEIKQKQAVKEFAEKLKEYINNKVIADFDDSDSVKYYTVDLDEFESEIDELLKEYEVEE